MQKTQDTQVQSLVQEDPLEKGLATHSSILDWKIPWTGGAWQATVHGVAESDMTECTQYIIYIIYLGKVNRSINIF